MCLLDGPENGIGILLGMLFKKWPELGFGFGMWNTFVLALEPSILLIMINQTFTISRRRSVEFLVSFFLMF